MVGRILWNRGALQSFPAGDAVGLRGRWMKDHSKVVAEPYDDDPMTRLWHAIGLEAVEVRRDAVARRSQRFEDRPQVVSVLRAGQASDILRNKERWLEVVECANPPFIQRAVVAVRAIPLPHHAEVVAGKPERQAVNRCQCGKVKVLDPSADHVDVLSQVGPEGLASVRVDVVGPDMAEPGHFRTESHSARAGEQFPNAVLGHRVVRNGGEGGVLETYFAVAYSATAASPLSATRSRYISRRPTMPITTACICASVSSSRTFCRPAKMFTYRCRCFGLSR